MKNVARRRAFTLLELVIVFAIVAILSAVLLGVFQRVRENGQSSVCQSNMHQISLALQQYVQDNNSRFPAGGQLNQVLSSYVKDEKIFYCPLKPKDGETDLPYFLPRWLWRGDWKAHKIVDGRHEADIPAASSIVSLVEPAGSDESEEVTSTCISTPQKTRHFDGNNYAFADGHVKWLSAQQFVESWCESFKAYPDFYKN